jgi:hypothetical protein
MGLEKWGTDSPNDQGFLQSRREMIRADIAKRLRNVCRHLSDQEFAKLVESMVDQKIKGERRRSL